MTDDNAPPGGSTGGSSSGPRMLRRSRSHRMLAGVCGGIGEYTSIDPNLVRLVVALLSLFGGSGVVLYVAGWLLIPEEGQDRSLAQQWMSSQRR